MSYELVNRSLLIQENARKGQASGVVSPLRVSINLNRSSEGTFLESKISSPSSGQSMSNMISF